MDDEVREFLQDIVDGNLDSLTIASRAGYLLKKEEEK